MHVKLNRVLKRCIDLEEKKFSFYIWKCFINYISKLKILNLVKLKSIFFFGTKVVY